MKKFFSFILALAATVAVNAVEITMSFADASAFGYANPASGAFTQVANGNTISQDGVVLTATFTSGNGFRFFAHSTTGVINLRGYKDASLQIAAPAGKKLHSVSIAGSNLGSDYVSGDVVAGEWTGEAETITLNVIKSTVQMNSMVIVYGDEGEVAPVWTPDTVGVTEARALIDAHDNHSHYVIGVVSNDAFGTQWPGWAMIWMRDLENVTDTLEGYQIYKDANNTKWDSAEDLDLSIGDTVLIFAKSLTTYKTIYETSSGYFVEKIGGTQIAKTELSFTEGTLTREPKTNDYQIELTNGDNAPALAGYITVSDITKFAGSYAAEDVVVTLTDGEVELDDANLTFTFVKVENGAHVYHVSMSATLDDVKFSINQDIAFTCSETTFGGYDDGTLIPKMTVARAIQEAQNGNTDNVYVYGYASNILRQYNHANSQGKVYANADFYLSDDPTSTAKTDFEAYGCTPVDKKDSTVIVGQLYCVYGPLSVFYSTIEISRGTYTPVDALPADIQGLDPELAPDTISADKAYEIGMALNNTAAKTSVYSDKSYVVIGYCVSISSKGAFNAEKMSETFYMANEEGAYGNFQAYNCTVDAEVFENDKMMVEGRICNYCGQSSDGGLYNNIEISQGKAVHTDKDIPVDTAIPQVLIEQSNERTIKTFENGQIILIKNGVKYNLLGTQL